MASDIVRNTIEILVKLGIEKEAARRVAPELIAQSKELSKALNDEAKRASAERIQLSKSETATEIQNSKERIVVLQQASKMALAVMKMETDAAKSAAKEREEADKAASKKFQAGIDSDAALHKQAMREGMTDIQRAISLEKQRADEEKARIAEFQKNIKNAADSNAAIDKQRQAAFAADEKAANETMAAEIKARQQVKDAELANLEAVRRKRKEVFDEAVRMAKEQANLEERSANNEITRSRQYDRAAPLASARGFTSLGMGTWAVPGVMQDQSVLIDNILLGAGALAQMEAQFNGLRETAEAAGVGLGGMLASMLPVVAASVALTVGLKMLQDRIEAVGKAEQALVDARKKSAEAAAQAVGQERNLTMFQLRQNEADNQRKAMAYDDERTSAFNRVAELQNKIAALDRMPLGNFGDINVIAARMEYAKQLEIEQKALTEVQSKIDDLNAAQRTNVNILEPLVAKWEQFNRTLEKGDQLIQFQQQKRQMARTGTSESLGETYQSNQDEIAALTSRRERLQRLLDGTNAASGFRTLTPDQTAKLKQDLSDIGTEISRLTQNNSELLHETLPLIQAREREAAAIKAAQFAEEQRIEALNRTANLIREKFGADADAIIQGRTGSSAGLRSTMEDNKAKIAAEEAFQNQLWKEYRDNFTPEEFKNWQAELQKSQDIVRQLTYQNEQYNAVSLPQVLARERERFIVEQQTRAFERHTRQIEMDIKAMDQAVQKADEYSSQINDERAKRGKQVERQLQDDLITSQREAVVKDYQRRIDLAREQDRLADNAKKRQKIIDDAARAEIKANQDLQEKFKDIDAKYKNRVDDINRNYMEKSLDELDKFQKAHIQKEDDYYKKRNRLIEDSQDKLIVLAAERDVAGFILEQREFEKKLRRLDEDHKTEADQDAQAYQNRLKELQDNLQKQLEAARADYDLQRMQAQEHYDLDKQQRQAALDERLRMEDENNKTRLSRADTLEKELQALREQWQKQDEARRRLLEEQDYQERMKRLQKFYDDQKAIVDSLMYNVYGNIPKSVARLGPEAADAYTNRKYLPDRFATGLDYVPRDFFPAFLDKGEAVLTAREADDWRAGRGGGSTMNFNISYYSRDLASKDDIQQASREMAGWIAQTVRGIRR